MGIRKRKWTTTSGEKREGWAADYMDPGAPRDARGRQKRIVKTFATQKAAKAFLDSVTVAKAQGKSVTPTKATVRMAGEAWIATCKVKGLEASTVEQYEAHLKLHVNPFLAELRLLEVTLPVIDQWQTKLRNEGRSNKMVRLVRTSLSSLLSDAMAKGNIGHNVLASMPRQRVADRHREPLKVGRDIPTPDELDALLAAETNPMCKAMWLLAARCGLRASELRGLTWANVNLDKSTVTIEARADKWGHLGSPKSKGSRRTVPMPSGTRAALQAWKIQCPAGDLVFPNSNGKPRKLSGLVETYLQPSWKRAGVRNREGGAKYTGMHAFRHFFVSWCLARKPVGRELPLFEVSKLAGHSSIAITANTYSHLIEAPDALAELDAAQGKFG